MTGTWTSVRVRARCCDARRCPPERPCTCWTADRPPCGGRAALTGHRVETHQQDIFDRWELGDASVDSVAMSLVFHTLPGQGIRAKSHAVEEAARELTPGGHFFGATIVRHGRTVRVPAQARWLMDTYNRRGYFANAGDDADDLDAALHASFGSVRLWSRGCVALWVAGN
ncbi:MULTISPECIES: class I SAM-dependent methyltransferase [unclassified Streptomyces]|uniref:class I SAM-dependent methyltransferase n=1 Tax=unclassified Streptomyces TaxID=2593676 RepID=UPI002DDBE286|nr:MULTISPECIES: class I SAM-dependent methyltransferase [unclassified Streptomyces]WSA90369.1 class I SAM-dependent methyltransferase [Streptomyces sp. NBC_01795]WSS17020.1 class I SAM-dependent methyltransferase [Streptomyces sp. NBC_01186]WSS45763.1 class I SAM-dependent methyltransferase [Streptomyces sp. NBC_01187]